jgi:hypothetical protein
MTFFRFPPQECCQTQTQQSPGFEARESAFRTFSLQQIFAQILLQTIKPENFVGAA